MRRVSRPRELLPGQWQTRQEPAGAQHLTRGLRGTGTGCAPGGTARADAELRPTGEQSHAFKGAIFNHGGCKHVLSLDYGHKQLFTLFEKLLSLYPYK